MTLPPERLDRFARHIVLPEIGGAGQAALAQSSVALIGLGGIGSPALQYLASAGIGTLVLFDDGEVELSNLQRQTIYAENDVGKGKVDAAMAWLRNFDDQLTVTGIRERITTGNAARLMEGVDLVLDGTDNFATRLAISDGCVAAGTPLLSAAVGRFQGQVGAFAGHLPDQPCYRCYVGDAFDADDCDTCAEDGILGAMAGWTATFAVLQAIRILVSRTGGLGDPQWGKLHLMDGLAPSMRTMSLVKDPACKACGSTA
ncbi:molybdopterin/thiamine biosynthesis adenylyltransferase [Altererythrobacter atlanticus]|uniref:Molybdopterin-synthase adenylyltransferase n=1 Tax=Croceibacterium atlanticum TaxID=1267766 RepID=A0A0F7KQ76_9SPHN|nr:HesA/MoeB/ThiF family protein [Croceibacterium atlanticum]AKH42688.1 Molybdopterin-synthase adenylyltransferase [Croceibacterium atlanticum]MBB5731465.1 molybdopterin/thiamine biosynthesis adenylyltransferase [Croceibacterium atlanticum]